MAKCNIEELELLKNKALLFNQFMIGNGLFPTELIPALQASNKLIEDAFEQKRTAALKEADRNINEQVRHMPIKMALELKTIFKEKLGIDYEIIELRRLKEIQKILKRKKIQTNEAYELIRDRADEIYTDTDKQEELERLNKLLAAFEQRKNIT